MKNIILTFLAVLLAISGFFPIVGADEVPEPPADPQRKAQIEQWVKDLGNPDYAVREQATKELKKAGDDAVFALIPVAEEGDDLEMVQRAREILDNIAWAPPSVRKKIDAAIETLKTSRDMQEWQEAMEELQRLGKPARKAYEEIAKTSGGDGKLELAVEKKTVKRGEPLDVELRLTNTGKKGIWIAPMSLAVQIQREPFFEPKRQANNPFGAVMAQAIVAGNVMGGGVQEPPFLYLAPGETYTRKETRSEQEMDWIGKVTLTATYNGATAAQVGGRQMIRIIGGGGMRLQVQQGRNAGQQPEDEEAWPAIHPAELNLNQETVVRVLPPVVTEPEKLPVVDGLKLTASVREGEAPEGKMPVRLTLHNRSDSEVKIPAYVKGDHEGLWYVVLDEKGEFVAAGGIPGGKEDLPEEREWTGLEAGKTLDLDVEIPVPAEEGKTYRVVTGLLEAGIPQQFRQIFQMARGNAQMRVALGRQFGGGNMPPEDAWEGTLYSNALPWPVNRQ